jgi:SAM-dependent methyltransferase
MDTTGLEGTYDMVILIHTIIYMTSPNDCLMKCRELIKPNGSLLIVAIHKDPLNELFDRFWYLSAGRKVNFLPDITGVLDTMEGCHYTITTTEGVLDITQYVANGFKSPQQSVALDFIIHTKLANFSQSVRDKCVEYLISISYGKPEKHFVRHIVDLITVKF